MEHLNDIFRKCGQIYNGRATMVRKLFSSAMSRGNEGVMKALIFPGSPVLTFVPSLWDPPYLQLFCSEETVNLVIVQLLIDFGVNIDEQDVEWGNTALHSCAIYRRTETDDQLNLVKLLLKNGAKRYIRNKHGFTPIELNLFQGNLEMTSLFLNEKDQIANEIEFDRTKRCRHLVKCLLQKKKDWNISTTNYSVLMHFLLLEKDEETFDYVAKNIKFDVNAINHKGNTLLHLVTKSGTARMVRTLINIGADLDVFADNGYFRIPLTVAISNSRIEIFHCLLDGGAQVNKIEENRIDTNSPLHYAVCIQSFEMVEKLVKLGADVNALTYHRSPLLLACGSIYSRKWPLLTTGVNSAFNLKSELFDDEICNFPFSVKIVEFLLDHGADIEAKNASNRSSLDQACKFGRLDIVKLLLNRGAKINQGDVSTLHHAVRGENSDIVKLILEKGANVNYRCAPEKILFEHHYYAIPPPRTPLECAVDFILDDFKCRDIIKVLLKHGASLNVAEVRRETPLHLVCFSDKTDNFIIRQSTSRPETLKILMRHNTNVNALDSNGMTFFNYALRNYILNIRENITSNPLKPDLEIIISFLAKMIANREWVINKNLRLLEDEAARPIYQKCLQELSFMKTNICESRNFSFFNILSTDIVSLGNVLKNEDILLVLNSGEYKEKFPTYSEYLEERILEASIRQPLVDLTIVSFHNHMNTTIGCELILNIFKFLSLDDLKNCAKACHDNIE